MREVVVVGPCGVGKSTLAARLRKRGLPARSVAQEHSTVPDLFMRHGEGEAPWVVYLAATLPSVRSRRPDVALGAPQYRAELDRLARAKRAAHVIVHTDGIDADEVERRVVAWIRRIDPDLASGL
jgi:predicted ATPase